MTYVAFDRRSSRVRACARVEKLGGVLGLATNEKEKRNHKKKKAGLPFGARLFLFMFCTLFFQRTTSALLRKLLSATCRKGRGVVQPSRNFIVIGIFFCFFHCGAAIEPNLGVPLHLLRDLLHFSSNKQ